MNKEDEEYTYDHHYQPKKLNGNAIRQHATCLRILFPIMVCLIWAYLVAAYYFVHVEERRPYVGHRHLWKGSENTLKSCTYEQLETAFGRASQEQGDKTSSVRQLQQEEKCWRVTDWILRVPKSAILNFDSLISIGSGNKSGVFMAILDLGRIGQEPCKAVYKTDLAHTNLCDNVWKHPLSSKWSHTKSCLSAHLNPFGSSMWGELTGGVIFQAFQQYALDDKDDALDTSGIIPTWAIVPFHEDDDNTFQKHESVHQFSLRRRNYPDILGVIMPYEKMKPLEPSVAREQTTAGMAALLQSAAQSLALIHELGLTHQDLVTRDYKNVGLVESPDGNGFSRAVLFDWGYTALDDNDPATGQDQCTLGQACDFCVESYFPSPRVGGSHGNHGERRRTLDCENLRTMVNNIWNYVKDSTTEGKHWQSQMQQQVDCGRSTQELADFLSKAAKGCSV